MEDRRRSQDRVEEMLLDTVTKVAESGARQEALMAEMVTHSKLIHALERETNWIKGLGAGLSFIWTAILGWIGVKAGT